RLPMLFDQTAVAVLSRETGVDFERAHGFVGESPCRVQLLLGPSLDEHIAALPLFISRQVFLDLSDEGVKVRKRPVLRGKRRQKKKDHERNHSLCIIARFFHSASGLIRYISHVTRPRL